jgi:hypothetical protein
MQTRAMVFLSVCGFAIVSAACDTPGGMSRSLDSGAIHSDDGGDSSVALDASVARRDAGNSVNNCSERARSIYLFDRGDTLIRYEPETATFTEIGRASCVPTLWSMTVDRQGTAYVWSDEEQLFEISTVDASCRSVEGLVTPPNFMRTEALGFVSQSAGSTAENLFVTFSDTNSTSRLGRVDFPARDIIDVAPMPAGRLRALTGNGAGELWGSFARAGDLAVVQIDKGTGAVLQEIDVSSIDETPEFTTGVIGMAFWGGRLYLFYDDDGNGSSSVFRVTPGTREIELVQANIGYQIIGAGVSTCAPIELF